MYGMMLSRVARSCDLRHWHASPRLHMLAVVAKVHIDKTHALLEAYTQGFVLPDTRCGLWRIAERARISWSQRRTSICRLPEPQQLQQRWRRLPSPNRCRWAESASTS